MASKLLLRLLVRSCGSSPLLPQSVKWTPCYADPRFSLLGRGVLQQRFGFSSPASPQPAEEADAAIDVEQYDNDECQEASTSVKRERKRSTTTSFSDLDEELDLSKEDLVKLVAEKEELLKLKNTEIEKMQDKVLRSYADMENIMCRTKREGENAKKFAVQNFAKSLLDVADNLTRASSVVKKSFLDVDQSKDSGGAMPLLKTLLEGVEMTEKQLAEVFRKFGIEKFDPINEQFDPNRHMAVFQIPDSSKEPGIVAAVLKPGYMLHERIMRPAEVGVTMSVDDQSSGD